VCITGIVPGFKGNQAEHAAERRGARTTKNVSSKTALLVIGHNAGRDKLNRAELYNTPTITAREFLALV
jgi:replication factor C subunit 1